MAEIGVKPKEQELIDQIKADIDTLKQLGFYELLMKELTPYLIEINDERLLQPSRLVMDSDFKIFLPDYGEIEIVMTSLPKPLFILFLRHPEGIYLKSLIDYKKELLEIYKMISYREKYADVVESIDRICNPSEGSINEKLSRIKEAFHKKIPFETAKRYIVQGERGMAKSIDLDRSIVTLPSLFDEIAFT